MAPEDAQRLADASEHDNTQRWTRRRDFGAVVAEAVRRADARRRLELCLARPPVDRVPVAPSN